MELTQERMRRKVAEIDELLRATSNDWNQALIISLFRVLGGFGNREAMIHLAETVGHTALARERGSIVSLEALILGSAGLLNILPEDAYIVRLKQEATHLFAKYDITPMQASEWQLNTKYPNNNPILRLVQIAATLFGNMITIANVMACRSRRDIYKLFSCNTSRYWIIKISQEISSKLLSSKPLSRRLGYSKSDILGINLVIPFIYAYRHYTSFGDLSVRPSELLMDIPSESNVYTKLWQSYARISHSALESQALIQLSREYCEKGACNRCPIAKYTL